MDRRQAMTAIGTAGGLALARDAAALQPPAQELKVSIVIPELYSPEGKLQVQPTLRNSGYGSKLIVVIENVSKGDVYVWAEGNSEGNGTLSFEVSEANGKKTTVKRIPMENGKNIIRAERLIPGGYQVRVIEYDTPKGKQAQWEEFPFGETGSPQLLTLRAIFEQPKREQPKNAKQLVWSGKIVSEPLKVVLINW